MQLTNLQEEMTNVRYENNEKVYNDDENEHWYSYKEECSSG